MAAMLVSGLAVASSVQAPGAPPAGDNQLCLIQIREGQRPVFQTADVLANPIPGSSSGTGHPTTIHHTGESKK
jgi:hypothetical protein